MGLCPCEYPVHRGSGRYHERRTGDADLEQLGMYSAKFQRGEITEEKLDWAKCNACPSCGACSFIGTASTMQIMAEFWDWLPSGKCPDAGPPARICLPMLARPVSKVVKMATMEHMRPSDIKIHG